MQTVLRAGVACPAGTHTSRQPCTASTSGRVQLPAARMVRVAPRAVKNEDAELERITREAGQSDVWDNEIIGTGLKIALVAGVVAVAVFIGRLGEPIVTNTINSFPTPADYEAYDQSR